VNPLGTSANETHQIVYASVKPTHPPKQTSPSAFNIRPTWAPVSLRLASKATEFKSGDSRCSSPLYLLNPGLPGKVRSVTDLLIKKRQLLLKVKDELQQRLWG